MTQVSTTTAAAGAAQTSASAGSKPASVDYNSFLQLLCAQLQNQDPTQPMDSTAYMSQLASFSQVEQSVSTNSKLDSLLAVNAMQTAGQAIGRTVTSADGSVTGTVASVQITSSGPVATLGDGRTVPLSAGVTVS